LPKDLARWEYRSVPAQKAGTLEQQAEAVARRQLNMPEGKSLTKEQGERLKALKDDIAKLNEGEGLRYLWVRVPAGAELNNPEATDKSVKIEVEEESTLGAVAARELGRAYKAQALFKANKDVLVEPKELPAEAELKVPQTNWPALVLF